MSTTISFHTLGCKLNHVETSALQSKFVEGGFHVVEFGEKSDLVVINSCTVTTTADAECRQIVNRAKKNSPGSSIIVTGCYAERDPNTLLNMPGVVAVFGNKEKHRIVEYCETHHRRPVPTNFPGEQGVFFSAKSMADDGRTRAFLKLQDGCDYVCTFCTIPMVRGQARALPLSEVRKEIETLSQSGCHEVVLTGVNVGEYRDSNDNRFVDVARLIEEMQPPFRVRISSIEPNTLSNEVIELVSESNHFVPHFHIPLQSGSATLLRNMKRRYNPERYKATVQYITQLMPHAALGIDVIVGFPGETDELFEESLQFIESLPFAYLHAFTYSERPNTPAASMRNKVPERIRKNRNAKIRQLSAARNAQFELSNIGTVRTVLPEKFDNEIGGWVGWTENYVKSVLHLPSNAVKQPYMIEMKTENLYRLLPLKASS